MDPGGEDSSGVQWIEVVERQQDHGGEITNQEWNGNGPVEEDFGFFETENSLPWRGCPRGRVFFGVFFAEVHGNDTGLPLVNRAREIFQR